MKYLTLEYLEEVETIDEFAGTLHYCDETGEDVEARFLVRCPEKDGDSPFITTQRQDAFNSQYTDICTRLMASGCKEIKFVACKPDPFF